MARSRGAGDGARCSFVALVSFLFGAAAAADPMNFDVIYMNHTNIIVADGEITAETPAAFQAFLGSGRLDGFIFEIHLNSPGGNLYGGMELGRMIRRERLASDIAAYARRDAEGGMWDPPASPGICASACALAFLGGERRHVMEGSILGFHQFSGNGGEDLGPVLETQAATQIVSGELLSYITGMGASAALFSKLSAALPGELFEPSRAELEVLDIVSRSAFRGFTLEPFGAGVVAYATFPENIEGRQRIGQITAYCKGKEPYLLLSLLPGDRPMNDWELANLEEMNGGFRIFRQQGGGEISYPAGNVRVRKKGPAVLEARIDRTGIDLIKGGAMVFFDVPAMVGMYGGPVAPSEEDVKLLESAFRLCIS